jgi:hypothetical protein
MGLGENIKPVKNRVDEDGNRTIQFLSAVQGKEL